MSRIYASPSPEILRLEVDPHAELHQPERPFLIALFNPEVDVLDEDVSHAVINLSRAELRMLYLAAAELLTDSTEKAELGV